MKKRPQGRYSNLRHELPALWNGCHAASGLQVTLFYSDLETSDFISAKISPESAPAPGTIIRVRVVTSQGIQSNEVTATAK